MDIWNTIRVLRHDWNTKQRQWTHVWHHVRKIMHNDDTMVNNMRLFYMKDNRVLVLEIRRTYEDEQMQINANVITSWDVYNGVPYIDISLTENWQMYCIKYITKNATASTNCVILHMLKNTKREIFKWESNAEDQETESRNLKYFAAKVWNNIYGMLEYTDMMITSSFLQYKSNISTHNFHYCYIWLPIGSQKCYKMKWSRWSQTNRKSIPREDHSSNIERRGWHRPIEILRWEIYEHHH